MRKLLLILFIPILSQAQLRKDQLNAINARDIKSSGAYSSFKMGKLIDSLVLSLNSQRRASGYLPIGNGSGISVDVPLSGDATLSNAGVLSVIKIAGLTLPANSDGVLTNAGGILTWGSGGTTTFVGLSDGPGSFSGNALNFTQVNPGETALRYRSPSQVLSDISAQPLDSDLTTISGLTATTDNFMVSVSSAWASRTPAQVKTTLSLNNVENTALSTWAGSSNITTVGTLSSGSIPYSLLSGTVPTWNQNTTGTAAAWTTGRTLSITGDLSYTSPSFDGSANVTAAGTLATVNSNVGSFGSATQTGTFTVNGKGLITAASNVTITPSISSVTGLGSNWLTPLQASLGSGWAAALGATYSVAPPTTGTSLLYGNGAGGFSTAPTEIGSVFTESWANLTNWSNVGTPSATVSGGQLTLSGSSSSTTNYIKNSSYGKFNYEYAEITWTETVGTVGASTSGVAFSLQSNGALGSSYQNSIMCNVELSSTGTGTIKWYENNSVTAVQTQATALVPVQGDVLNLKLKIYPNKYVLSYSIGSGQAVEGTYYLYTGMGFPTNTGVGNNASNFAFINLGNGATKHTIGALTVTAKQRKNIKYLIVGNSIASGYSSIYFYNRFASLIQKRYAVDVEVLARPSNSIQDFNSAELTAFNAQIIVIACAGTNDVVQNGASTAFTNYQTFVTSLASLVTANAPSGYSVANGNLKFVTEIPRTGIATIPTFNSSIVSTYGIANVISGYGMLSDGTTTLPIQWTFEGVHPNDLGHSIMADGIAKGLNLTNNQQSSNSEFFLYADPNQKLSSLGNGSYINSLSGGKLTSHNAFQNPAGTWQTGSGTTGVLYGMDNTNGFVVYTNSSLSTNTIYTPTLRFKIDYTGLTTLSGNLTVNGTPLFSVNQNASTASVVSNTTSGTAAQAVYTATSDIGSGSFTFGKNSTLTTPYKTLKGKDAALYNGSAGGDISILNDYTSGGFGVAVGGSSTNALSISSSGNVTIGAATNIVGTTTNNNAAAGNIGEAVESKIAIGSAVSLTTATAANITSISLTAGDWEVEGNVNFSETTATVSARTTGINTTSATLPTDGTEVENGVQSTVTSEKNSCTMPKKRVSISSTTIVYLVGSATFSAGTCIGYGYIKATRIR